MHLHLGASRWRSGRLGCLLLKNVVGAAAAGSTPVTFNRAATAAVAVTERFIGPPGN